MLSRALAEPTAQMRPFVAHYVHRRGQGSTGRALRPVTATPNVLLVLHFAVPPNAFEYETGCTRQMPAAFVVGPHTGRRADVTVDTASDSLVVQFMPGGFHRLFRVDVSTLADRAVEATQLVGPGIEALRVRLAGLRQMRARVRAVESFLATRLAHARPEHPAAIAATQMVASRGQMRVADAVHATGLSSRHFERAFIERMGVTPKQFLRAVRLEFALTLKRGNPAHSWTRVSQEAGYFDQTHFVKDFKALAGETPSSFPLPDATGFYYHRRGSRA